MDANAIAFFFFEQNGYDQKIFASFCKKSQNSKMLKQRYQEMQNFVHSEGCMQQEILAYFGQTAKRPIRSVQTAQRSEEAAVLILGSP